jgi:transposase InsO family protein
MRFALIDAEKAVFPVRTMCRVLDVSESGFFAWRGRPASQRQRDDMIYLAHIRTAFELSNRTYGSPRMHRELVDEGLPIGRRRTTRLMRDNGLAARQTPFQAHNGQRACLAGGAEPCWIRTSRQRRQTRSGAPTSLTSGPPRDGSISPFSSTSSHGVWSAGRSATG